MGHQFRRIHVYGAQRKNIDPVLLAQVVILLGRHLQQQHQQSKSLGRENPGSVESSTEHGSPTTKNDADGAGGGTGELS